VLGRDRGGLITISALAAIWAASNGVEAFRLALDRAYSVGAPRSFLRRRLIAIAFVFVAVASFAVLAVVILLAPSLILLAESFLGLKAPPVLGLARCAVGLGVFLVFLFSLHRFLPSRGMGRHRLWPGVALTTVLWMTAAQAFSIYLANAPSYAMTYGALAGVIVTLLFLYLTGALIIFGAEYNAAIEAAEADE
jgi:membrane protein